MTTATELATATPKEAASAPIAKANYGTISVAAFDREVSAKTGDIFTAVDFNIRKSFKKADGSWDHVSISIGRKDVFNVITALQQCYADSYQAGSPKASDAAEL